MSDYTIIKLSKENFDVLIPLMKNCFGQDVNINYFQWKYIDNPTGEFVGFIATSDSNEVAAYYGAIPELYSIDGVETIIYQSCDTMTHSDHRRKGLFNKLATHCYDYLKEAGELFVIGFGGAQSTPGFIKMGWSDLFTIRYYFYPKLFSKFSSKSNENEFQTLNNFDSIQSAILSSNNTTKIHSHKSLEIFKWRLSNPKFEYKVITLKGEAPDSYLCYYIEGNKVIIFDYSVKNQQTGKKLFKYLKSILKNSNHQGIIAFCQESSSFSKGLKNYGFISNPFKKGPLSPKIPFILYSTEEKMDKYKDASLWNISSFDHDSM
jgi:hypothetical protein